MERYSRDHVWARAEGALVRIGISAFAQQELGDIAYVELPQVGRRVARGETACVIESLKSSSEVYAPVAGTVVALNERLRDEHECRLVNRDPLGEGWLFAIEPDEPRDIEGLMDREGYERFVTGAAASD